MSSVQAVSPSIPQDVARFAAEQGVSMYLLPVLQMTEAVFPGSRVGLLIDDDPEIADERHVVIKVTAGNMDVSTALEARYRWHQDLFTCCPAALAPTFRLDLELSQ